MPSPAITAILYLRLLPVLAISLILSKLQGAHYATRRHRRKCLALDISHPEIDGRCRHCRRAHPT